MGSVISSLQMSEGFPGPQIPGNVPPTSPKAKFLDKRFWIGFGAGAVAGASVLFVGLIIFTLIMTGIMRRTMNPGEPEAPGGAAAVSLPPPPIPLTRMADYSLHLESLDGAPFDARALEGKVVFLNFWATWCGPCRMEMPAIQRLYDKVKGDGVVFLAVSDEDSAKIKAFVKKSPYTFPFYRITGKRPGVYETEAIPATFILAPDGRVALRHVGSAAWDDVSTIGYLATLKAKAN